METGSEPCWPPARLPVYPSTRLPADQSNAAPVMMFRINNHGEPCEIAFVCVGCPLASPPVPNIWYSFGPVVASRFAQKSVVIALYVTSVTMRVILPFLISQNTWPPNWPLYRCWSIE